MEQDARGWVADYFTTLNTRPKSPEVLGRFIGEDDLLHHIAGMERAFPGYQMTAEDVVADRDRVAVRFTMTGQHLGELQGLAPTGRQVRVPGIIIYRLAGGRVAEHWMQVDAPGMMAQLTADLPVPT